VRSISTAADPFGFVRNRRNQTTIPAPSFAGPMENSFATNTPIIPAAAKENQPSTSRTRNPRNRSPLGDAASRHTLRRKAAPSLQLSPQRHLNPQPSRPPLRPAAPMTALDAENSGSTSLISITPPTVKSTLQHRSRPLPTAATLNSSKMSSLERNRSAETDLIKNLDGQETSSPLQTTASARNFQRCDISGDEEAVGSRQRRNNVDRNTSGDTSTPNTKPDRSSQYIPSMLSPLSELSHSPSTAEGYNMEFHTIITNAGDGASQQISSNRISNEDRNNYGSNGLRGVLRHRDSDHTMYTTDDENTTSILDRTMASTVVASPSKRATIIPQPPTTVISQSSSSTVMTQVLHQKRFQHLSTELQQTQQELLRVHQEQKKTLEQRDYAMQECNTLRQQREQDIAAALQKAQNDHDARLQYVQARYEQDWEEIQNTVAELEQEHLQRETDLTQWQEELRKQQSVIHEQELMLEEQRQQEHATYQRRVVGAEQRLEQQMLLLEEQAARMQLQEEAIRQEREALQHDQRNHEAAVTEFHQAQKDYESQYVSMEEAIRALDLQHEETKVSLQQAIQQRQSYLQQTETMEMESQRKMQSLRDEIQIGTTEVQEVHRQIREAQTELDALKHRIRVLVEADQTSRQATAAASAKADQELTAMLAQLQVAQRERHAIVESITQHQQEYDGMKEQMLKEEERFRNEQERLNEQVKGLETLRKTTQDEIKAMVQSTNIDLAARKKALDDRIEMSNRELQRNTEHLEQKQRQLDEAIHQHESHVAQLRHDKHDHQKRNDDLQQRMSEFSKMKHREQRLRVELERKVERLTNLIQVERAEHSNQLKSIDSKVKDRKQHQEQIILDWTEQYKVLEAELYEKRQDVETLQQSLANRDTTISLLKKEIIHLQEELSAVTARYDQVEEREHEDLEKIREFMGRLEAQASALEEQEEQNVADRERLDALQLEYEDRINRLNQEREEFIAESKTHAKKSEIDSLITFLNKPWRPEGSNLSVSDAFSKWMRETLLPAVGEDEETARDQLLDIERHVTQLQMQYDDALRMQSEAIESFERERQAKRELHNQIRFHREKEQQLYDDIQRLSREKLQVEQSRRRESRIFLVGSDDAIEGYDDSLAQREAEIARKEELLARMEASTQEKELQIAEANDRIRMMASQLRQKETDLEAKEAGLVSQQKAI
jgi:chromosome segregation ATPase